MIRIRRHVFAVCAVLLVHCGETAPEPTCRDDGSCEVGAECDASAECATGICDGACRIPCRDEDECGEGESCRFVDAAGDLYTACVEVEQVFGDLGDPCASDDECRGGICNAGTCTELCSSCPNGAICAPEIRQGLAVGTCEWAPVAPTLSVGPIEATVDGTSDVMFNVPAGVESVTVIVRDGTPGGTRRVGIASLVAPDGTVLDNGDLDYSDLNPAAIRYPDASSVLVPGRDTVQTVESGVYKVTGRIWDFDIAAVEPFQPTSGDVYFDVVFEWADELGGLLDLNVFVAPGTDVSTDVDDAFLAAMLDVVEQKLAGAGVALGTVSGASISAEYDAIEDSDTIREVCRSLSAPGQYGAALNVFLVDRLEFVVGGGFTGGTPAPPGLVGRAPSGVMVDARSDAVETGTVLAHEIGHFLGVGHTTSFNQDGSVFSTDAISDTPECANAGSDCPDDSNLMFPNIDFGQENMLTPGQHVVLARNPMLYEFVRPKLCPISPPRDVTVTRRAAGLLRGGGVAEGSCGGSGPEAAHVLRVTEPSTLIISSAADAVLYVRAEDCEVGAEIACGTEGSLQVDVEPGEYFVFVDTDDDAGGAYRLDVNPFQR